MQRQEKYEWLRLIWTNGMTFAMAKTLLTEIGLPEVIFSSSFEQLLPLIPESVAWRLKQKIDRDIHDRIESCLSWLESTPNADMVTLIDSRYPKMMLTLPEPPLVFFVWGNTSCLQQRMVSLVGSRQPSVEGGDLSRSWSLSLAQRKIAIVEGLSEGVEREALRGAWKSKDSRVILVVDKGFESYAQEPLVKLMSEQHLVVSLQGPFDGQDNRCYWECRNRLLLGLCSSFVLVQASARSRSLTLLREALDLGRCVMAVPGSIHSPLSKGPHRLIKEGARLVETTSEVFEEMGYG